MSGKVWLVGAGPGDASLITVKGLECIKQADVLLYDRLVNPELLSFAKPSCEKIYVGKKSDHHPIPQADINQTLIDHARAGKNVVRLKSGDPYVFGRGGEEAQELVEQGVVFEVVPGVTSAIGGLSCAGIPVTHRDYASSFHVVTGHLRADKEKDPINWQAMAQLEGTIVILMGVSNLANISKELMQFGKPKETPVAIVMWASRDNQRVVTGTLEDIVQVAERQQVKPPALIVVGEVVRLHKLLDLSQLLTKTTE